MKRQRSHGYKTLWKANTEKALRCMAQYAWYGTRKKIDYDIKSREEGN